MHLTYNEKVQSSLKKIEKEGANILAIESSCDDTCAAVLGRGGELLSSTVASQIKMHEVYGGVVPEIASRKHIEALPVVTKEALDSAGVDIDDIDCVAATYGPGLAGALLCGLNFAKALAYAKGLPFVAVNHMEGHIFANYLTHKDLAEPYVCLIVSGGHTHLVYIKRKGEYVLLGQTCDDAAGEALDKAARALGLGYPGGPKIEKLALEGNPEAFTFTKPKLKGRYDFSFSGVKTALINILNTAKQKNEQINTADIAASFQRATIEFLLDKAFMALRDFGCDTLAVCGGVSANSELRRKAGERAALASVKLYFPEKRFCTDNAAMIASVARHYLSEKRVNGLDCNAIPWLDLPILQD